MTDVVHIGVIYDDPDNPKPLCQAEAGRVTFWRQRATCAACEAVLQREADWFVDGLVGSGE